jgi:hypothetical protein
MWTMAGSEVDPIAWQSSHSWKTMTTVLFGVHSIPLIEI